MLLKGWVYKYSYQHEILYIGSTEDKESRHKSHIRQYNSKNPSLFHKKLIENNLTFDDLELEYIEEIEFENVLVKLENKYIQELTPKYNIRNKLPKEQRIKEQQKKDKERYRERMRTDPEFNASEKEKDSKRKKKSRENHPEKNKEKCKKYYENNKDKINEEINCDNCHKLIRKCNKARHKKTKECINSNKEVKIPNKKRVDTRRLLTEEEKKQKLKDYYEKTKQERNKKEPCDNCGEPISKVNIKRHKLTDKCKNFKKN